MVVVNSKPFSGRIEEIPLDAHAAVIAENGSGKTVLIKLLPLFYGEEPRDVVMSYEQENFFGLYLPTVASYVAFEYVNHAGETRSVIMHSDPSGTSLQYRFVRGPLTRDMFLKSAEGAPEWVQSDDLEAHLRGAGHPVARRLVTSCRGYRSIIQGAPDATASAADRAFHAEMAQDYGLGTRKTPLTGVETLMMRMLRNDASLDTLLGIAADQALETDGGRVSILGRNSAKSLRQWPKDYEGYRRVMGLEGVFRDAEKVHRQIRTLDGELGDRIGALARIRQDMEAEIDALSDRVSALRAERSEKERADEEEVRALSRKVSELSSELEVLRGRMSRVRTEGERLRRLGADKAADKVLEIPQIRSDLDAAERHLERLSAGGRALADRYERDRSALMSRYRDEETRLRSEQAGALAKNQEEGEAALALLDREAEEADGQAEARLNRLESAVSETRARISDLRVRIAGVAPEEGEAGRLQDLQRARDAVATQERAASDLLRDANNEARDALLERERAEGREAGLRTALSVAERAHARLAAALAPEEGTLQHWLDRAVPDWTGTIGKVVSPELLSRRGLAPRLSEGDGSALFGVELNLDRLEPLVNPDLEARRAEAEKAMTACARAEADLAKGSADLTAAVKRADAARAALSEAEVAHQSAARRLDAAEVALETVRVDIELAVASRRAGLEADLAAAMTELSGREAALSAAREETRSARSAARAARGEAVAQQRIRADALREAHSRQLLDLAKRETAEQDRARQAYEAALRNEGLDTSAIAEAEGVASGLRERLREAEAARPRAQSWTVQVEQERELPALEGRERGCARQLGELSETRDAFLRGAEARRNLMGQEIRNLETKQDRLRRDAELIATALRDHEGAEPVRNDHVREGVSVNLDQLTVLKRTLREARDALRSRLTEIRSGFRKCGNETVSERLVGMREDEPEEMMTDLTRWFDADHHEVLGMLMRGISSIVTPIQTAYNDLVIADRAISEIGRKLRRAIQDMPGFPHVTDVELTIGCRLREETFWPDLEAFDEALNAWQAQHDEARSAALVSAMTRLLEHWSDGREPVVDFRSLLFIEGRLTERGNVRRFSRRTRLGELSSTGNVVILRLILFTALLTVMRQNRRVRFTWAVDEIGQLDLRNTMSLLEMLRANDIALVTAGPSLDPKVVPGFTYHLRILNGAVYLLPKPNNEAA
jgi:hypothetical protein